MPAFTRTTSAYLCGLLRFVFITGLVAVLSIFGGRVLAAPPGTSEDTLGVATGNYPNRRLEEAPEEVESLAFSPDGKYLIAGGRRDSPTVSVWDLTTGKVRYKLPSLEGGKSKTKPPSHVGFVKVAYSPDGKVIATACGYPREKRSEVSRILLWDTKRGDFIREVPANRGGIYTLAFSPDSKRILAGGGEGTASVWVVATGKEVQQFTVENRNDKVIAASYSSDGKSILLASERGELARGEIENGHITSRSQIVGGCVMMQIIPSRMEVLRLALDSRDYAMRRYYPPRWNGEVTPWRVEGPARGGTFVFRGAVSPEGKTLAVSEGRGLSLWSIDTGKLILIANLERGTHINVLTYSPDGEFLAAGLSSDSSVLLWDIGRLRLDALWAKLAISEGRDAEDYVKDLAALPKPAVAYLAPRLKRMAEAEKQVRQIVRALDDDDFEKREKASRQLRTLGRDAAFALEVVLEDKTSPEVRKRVEVVLTALVPPPPKPAPVNPKLLSTEQLALWKQGKWPPKPPVPSEARALKRAFAALETMGTPEARGLLKDLAETAPDGVVRDQAKASLGRLPKSKSSGP